MVRRQQTFQISWLVTRDSWMVNVSRFIQIIGQISRLPRSTALRAKGCASLEMTTKWIPAWLRRSASGLRRATPRRAPRRASKPPILPSLTTIYNLFMQNEPNLVRRRRIANSVCTMDYEEKSDWTLGENEPNSKPILRQKFTRRRRDRRPKIQVLSLKSEVWGLAMPATGRPGKEKNLPTAGFNG